MAQIIWTEPALNSLNDIAEYIAVNNTCTSESQHLQGF
jgi:plasmid stabilization system protein ParE